MHKVALALIRSTVISVLILSTVISSLLHQELQALRDKAEAQVSQTEGILLLAESPMDDILAGAAAARTRGPREEQGGRGGEEVWRRKAQMLEVKTQVEK